MVRPELHALLRPWLLSGERLLWAGRPKRGLVFRRSDLIQIPLSLAWGGIVFVMFLEETPFPRDSIFTLVGILFIAAAAYFTVGRFIHYAWSRSRVVYAVTDRRVLILKTGLRPRLRSLELTHLPMLELDEGRNGRGTIVFDASPIEDAMEARLQADWAPAASRVPRFLDIEGARSVYDLVVREVERMRRERLASLPPERAFIG